MPEILKIQTNKRIRELKSDPRRSQIKLGEGYETFAIPNESHHCEELEHEDLNAHLRNTLQDQTISHEIANSYIKKQTKPPKEALRKHPTVVADC